MTSTEQQPDPPAHEPITSTRWRAVLLASVAACAACGIIYELALLTLSTSLNGGGIIATSLIVAGYIAALGAGALLVKPLLHWAAIAFVAVEAVLAIVGGLSAAVLYVMFSFVGGSLLMLALGTALIGALVGAEVPLLMTLLQRGRTAGATDTGRTLANLNAADYLGALIGGLVWPFVLLPHLGMIRGAAATGIINLKRPAANGFTPTRSSPAGNPRIRRSWSPAAATTCGCIWTAVCSSPPATSIAIPRALSIPRWVPVHARCSYWVAATDWRHVNCCALRASTRSCKSSSTPRSSN
jgi:hypothetical protein